MAIGVFKESEIRKALLKKVVEKKHLKESRKHWTAKIYCNDIYVARITIPNSHKRDFKGGKARNLAKQLKLNDQEYSELIKCTLSKVDYYEIVEGLI